MLRQHEVAAVPHGFRPSFRNWAPRKRTTRERGLVVVCDHDGGALQAVADEPNDSR